MFVLLSLFLLLCFSSSFFPPPFFPHLIFPDTESHYVAPASLLTTHVDRVSLKLMEIHLPLSPKAGIKGVGHHS